MVLELVEKETLAKDDLERILAPVRKRPPHNTFAGFGKRTPSDRPPIEIPPSLRKPVSPNGGTPVNGGTPPEGVTLPGVQPQPNPPAPPAPPRESGTFGPTTFEKPGS
jgi:cell division protease FtsH